MEKIALKNVDWEIYLEREQQLYLFATFIRPYGELLKAATGFGFARQLQWFKGNTGTYYRSKKEMEAADKYYLNLIRNHDQRLKLWSEEGLKQNMLADRLIERFKNGIGVSEIRENFLDRQKQTEQIILYGTVIPFRVLSAANFALNNEGAKPEEFKAVLDLFEPLRGVSRYPQVVETIYRAFWRAAAEVTAMGDEELFSLTTPPELAAIFSGKAFDKKDLERRKSGCAFWLADDGTTVEFDFAKDFLDSIGIKRSVVDDVKEFTGKPANKGYAKGRVRIVNKIENVKDFSDGDIVVSISTNPELMPVLRKCAAIVTDEGGITCHAAIVSRELNIPCVIGTKIATKILKDGDLVEVDADNGIVRIIKQ